MENFTSDLARESVNGHCCAFHRNLVDSQRQVAHARLSLTLNFALTPLAARSFHSVNDG